MWLPHETHRHTSIPPSPMLHVYRKYIWYTLFRMHPWVDCSEDEIAHPTQSAGRRVCAQCTYGPICAPFRSTHKRCCKPPPPPRPHPPPVVNLHPPPPFFPSNKSVREIQIGAFFYPSPLSNRALIVLRFEQPTDTESTYNGVLRFV